jgi:hypothetical protein
MSEIRSKPATDKYRDNFDRVFRGGRRQPIARSVEWRTDELPDWSYTQDALVIKTVDGDIVIGGENGKRGRSSF